MLNCLDECVNENPFLRKKENLVDTRTTSDAILQMRKSSSIEVNNVKKHSTILLILNVMLPLICRAPNVRDIVLN